MRRPPAEYFEFNPATGLISAYTGTDVDVGVSREIGGVTVVGFEGYNVFASCQSFTNTETPTNQTEWVHLRTLVLPETIREIPDSLLMYCQQMESFIHLLRACGEHGQEHVCPVPGSKERSVYERRARD